jgi:hypothetical protein
MNPAHLLVYYAHVQFAAPKGYSAGRSALAHTIPRVAGSLIPAYSFPLQLFGDLLV